MGHLDQFLDIWLPATANGTYRALARWSGGYGIRNVQDFLPIHDKDNPDESRDLIHKYVANHKEVFIYMSTFRKQSTLERFAEPVPLLWLDLDTAIPQVDDLFYPSMIWETSQDHFQALWRLTSTPTAEERKEMNRAIYERYRDAGADPSYDTSRRLRLPGTLNNKPGREAFPIRVVEQTGLVFDPIELPRSKGIQVGEMPPPLETREKERVVTNLLTTLPPEIIVLLETVPPKGERSDTLMKLLLKLANIGELTPQDIFFITQGAGSNKFKSRPERLWLEVERAVAMAERPPEGFRLTSGESPVTRERLTESPPPSEALEGWRVRGELPEDYQIKWLYNPFLPKKSVLLVTGMPGTRKSWTVTDLAVSTALHKQFMGANPLDHGPVMYYAPDDEQERLSERVHLIEQFHDQRLKNDEFYWRQSGLHFNDPKWAVKLEAAMEVINPKIVIMDGLYLMGYNSENFGASLPQRLVPLKEMCSKYDMTFVLVHHSTKSRKEDIEDPRTAGMGSTLLGAFFSIAWSFENIDYADGRQKVQWRIGGKASPGRPNHKLSFGSNLTKYDPQVAEGKWSDEPEPTKDQQQKAEF